MNEYSFTYWPAGTEKEGYELADGDFPIWPDDTVTYYVSRSWASVRTLNNTALRAMARAEENPARANFYNAMAGTFTRHACKLTLVLYNEGITK